MKQEENQFLADYEDTLMQTLLRQITDTGLLEGELLAVEELDDMWNKSAAEYMAAAMPQLNDYPAAAVAWAAYMGMGLAVVWDTAWSEHEGKEELFTLLASPRGFDEMDEYVIEELLGYTLESPDAVKIEEMLRSAATTALTMIRKESIEAQSVMAFYIFARTTKVMYKLGVSVGLRLLGYRYHKTQMGVC